METPVHGRSPRTGRAPLESSFKEWKPGDGGEVVPPAAAPLESSFKEWKLNLLARHEPADAALESSFKEWKLIFRNHISFANGSLESSFKEWKLPRLRRLRLLQALLNLPLRNGNPQDTARSGRRRGLS